MVVVKQVKIFIFQATSHVYVKAQQVNPLSSLYFYLCSKYVALQTKLYDSFSKEVTKLVVKLALNSSICFFCLSFKSQELQFMVKNTLISQKIHVFQLNEQSFHYSQLNLIVGTYEWVLSFYKIIISLFITLKSIIHFLYLLKNV